MRRSKPAPLAMILAALLAYSSHAQPQHAHEQNSAGAGTSTLSDPVAPSTRAMAERFRAIYQATDWRLDATKPRERVAYYRKLLLTNLKPNEAAIVRLGGAA